MLFRTALTLTLTTFLTACAWAPGQHMDASVIAHDGSRESSQVELIPITPKIIAVDATQPTKTNIPNELLEFTPGNYRIGASDVLYITVWDHPELTAPSGTQLQGDANGRYVGPDGNLFYPYVGSVQAAGKTIDELRTEITARLRKYIDNPQVDINVLRFASQQVLLSGALERTQPVPITTRPLSIIEALGQGGINTHEADLSAVTLIRDNASYTLNIYALSREPSEVHHIYLKDKDRIHVPYNDNKKVYVMGEINHPQAIVYKSDTMNLTDAIGTSGGLEQITSKGKEVYVIRGVNNLAEEKAKIYQLDAKSPSAFILAGKFQLQPQDVVYIGAAGITRWNRLVSQLLPTLAVVGGTANTANDIENLGN